MHDCIVVRVVPYKFDCMPAKQSVPSVKDTRASEETETKVLTVEWHVALGTLSSYTGYSKGSRTQIKCTSTALNNSRTMSKAKEEPSLSWP